MKNTDSLLSENQYMILLSIPEETKKKGNALRKTISEKYLIQNKFQGSDILLAKFDSLSAREMLLIKSLNQVVKEADPFIISFKGIEKIPSHSYKIPATSKVELAELIKHLKKITRAIRAEETKPFFSHEFGITLFSKLKPFEYEALQPELEQTNVLFQCIVNEIKLLKRDKSSDSSWQLVKNFQLKKEEPIRQSLLF